MDLEKQGERNVIENINQRLTSLANFNKLSRWFARLDFFTFCRIFMLDLGRYLFFPNGRFYFSQGGEDIHILQLLKGKKKGFYVEVGSNHPVNYSNTFKLYLEGWNGILIDGNPTLIELSRRKRKADICLNEIVSDQAGEVEFAITPDPLFSHIKTDRDTDLVKNTIKKQTVTLTKILDQYIQKDQIIDLLSIDTEGHDLAVLKSLDFAKYKPLLIVVEDLGLMHNGLPDMELVGFLTHWKYILISRDSQNIYFKSE